MLLFLNNFVKILSSKLGSRHPKTSKSMKNQKSKIYILESETKKEYFYLYHFIKVKLSIMKQNCIYSLILLSIF